MGPRARRAECPAYALTGVAVGLSLLARVDTVFLVGLLGLFELLSKTTRQYLVWAIGAAVLIVTPWWSYSFLRFATPVPQSGAAVREQIEAVHRPVFLDARFQIAWGVGSVLASPFVELQGVRSELVLGRKREHAAAGVGILIASFILWSSWRRRGLHPGDRDGLRALGTAAVVVLCFYVFYVPALWFFRRYMEPVHAILGISIALTVAGFLARGWARWVAASLLTVGFLASAFVSGRWLVAPERAPLDTNLSGAKGYGAPAREILAMLPPGAVLGAMQSGALGYWANEPGQA